MYVFCLHVCLCKGVGKSNPGPFEEQSVFINAEPSLFSCFLFCFSNVLLHLFSNCIYRRGKVCFFCWWYFDMGSHAAQAVVQVEDILLNFPTPSLWPWDYRHTIPSLLVLGTTGIHECQASALPTIPYLKTEYSIKTRCHGEQASFQHHENGLDRRQCCFYFSDYRPILLADFLNKFLN